MNRILKWPLIFSCPGVQEFHLNKFMGNLPNSDVYVLPTSTNVVPRTQHQLVIY